MLLKALNPLSTAHMALPGFFFPLHKERGELRSESPFSVCGGQIL